jgi:hypothetical protein
MIRFICSNCGFQKEVGEKYLNHRVRCPVCKTTNKVTGGQVQTKEPEKDIIKFRCPSCNQKIGVPSDYSGRHVKCAKCQNAMVVPSKKVPARRAEPEPAIVQTDPESEDGFYDSSQMAELASETEAPYIDRSAARSSQGGDKKVILIIVGICVAFIVGFTVTFVLVSKMGDDKSQEQEIAAVTQEDSAVVDSYAVEDFAVDFIELLKQKKIEESRQLLVPTLQQRLNQNKIDKLAEKLSVSERLVLDMDREYLHPDNGAKYYVLFYTLGGEEQDEEDAEEEEVVWLSEDTWSVTVVLLDDSGDLKVEGITVGNFFEDEIALKTAGFDGVVEGAMLEVVKIFGSIGCGVFLFIGILFLITLISMCVVYSKAGQPAWAPFVPIYNFWVLAEIGDKPGWMGLGVIFAGAIPFVGQVIQIFLHVNICIGVAQAFDKGVIFGIGLTFLPFIFFPVLAISKE